MRKAVAWIVLAVLVVSLTACGRKKKEEDTRPNGSYGYKKYRYREEKEKEKILLEEYENLVTEAVRNTYDELGVLISTYHAFFDETGEHLLKLRHPGGLSLRRAEKFARRHAFRRFGRGGGHTAEFAEEIVHAPAVGISVPVSVRTDETTQIFLRAQQGVDPAALIESLLKEDRIERDIHFRQMSAMLTLCREQYHYTEGVALGNHYQEYFLIDEILFFK